MFDGTVWLRPTLHHPVVCIFHLGWHIWFHVGRTWWLIVSRVESRRGKLRPGGDAGHPGSRPYFLACPSFLPRARVYSILPHSSYFTRQGIHPSSYSTLVPHNPSYSTLLPHNPSSSHPGMPLLLPIALFLGVARATQLIHHTPIMHLGDVGGGPSRKLPAS